MAGRGPLLAALGAEVRSRREERGLSRKEASRRSGLSERYLAGVELGEQNISLIRLAELARALGCSVADLVAAAEAGAPRSRLPASRVVALLGLRGAGKTTVGRALARRLGVGFHELDQLIEARAGMPLGSIFEIHGERWFRRIERETLARFLVEHRAGVLATGGGIVTEPETFDLLLRNTITVWLRARPREHWDRVVAQGDSRPMANRARAREELGALLAAREPLYARASLVADTSASGPERTAADLAARLLATAA